MTQTERLDRARRRELLLRGVYELSTLSGVDWFAELADALLPEASVERAEVDRALATREAVLRDADAAEPLLDFNWKAPAGSPMDRIIDGLGRRGPRLVRDESLDEVRAHRAGYGGSVDPAAVRS